jgi:anaerobic ribonucleoside-triphosphate reductase activating protein
VELDRTFLIVDSSPPEFAPTELQVADIQDYSYVAGPGRRCVIWLAGCHRRCPGCFQPHYFSFRAGRRYHINELAERILGISGIDGVTFSGGEPFEQSAALASICRILKARSDLSLLSYSGYRLEWLRDESQQHLDFLETLDIIIDGEYQENEAGSYLWRGSRNQRVIYLKSGDDYQSRDSAKIGQQQIQITLTSSRVVLTGFPDEASSREFQAALERRGLLITAPQKEKDSDHC